MLSQNFQPTIKILISLIEILNLPNCLNIQ